MKRYTPDSRSTHSSALTCTMEVSMGDVSDDPEYAEMEDLEPVAKKKTSEKKENPLDTELARSEVTRLRALSSKADRLAYFDSMVVRDLKQWIVSGLGIESGLSGMKRGELLYCLRTYFEQRNHFDPLPPAVSLGGKLHADALSSIFSFLPTRDLLDHALNVNRFWRKTAATTVERMRAHPAGMSLRIDPASCNNEVAEFKFFFQGFDVSGALCKTCYEEAPGLSARCSSSPSDMYPSYASRYSGTYTDYTLATMIASGLKHRLVRQWVFSQTANSPSHVDLSAQHKKLQTQLTSQIRDIVFNNAAAEQARIETEMWQTRAKRKAVLTTALSENGLQLRSDSKLCSGWINNTLAGPSRPIGWVVAMMADTKLLIANRAYYYNHTLKAALWQTAKGLWEAGQIPLSSSSSSSSSSPAKAAATWTCNSCTVSSNLLVEEFCQVCETPRPEPVTLDTKFWMKAAASNPRRATARALGRRPQYRRWNDGYDSDGGDYDEYY
jgi:hypothetical protein